MNPFASIQNAVTDSAAAALQQALDWRLALDWDALIRTGLRLLVIVILAIGAYRVLLAVLRRIERSVSDADPTVNVREQRVYTLLGLVRSVGIVFIAVIALFMVLGAVGVNIAPLLAGAGVVGLAISFGAQSLVRDIITGLFILIENQFGVGDVIRLVGVAGTVEKMTLRIVVLRDLHGVVHIVPNGEIKQVSNLTRSFSRAVIEIGVAYREDADRVMEVMRDVCRELWEDPEWSPRLVEEPEVPGIERLGESSVDIRISATTLPTKQWEVARELRRRIKRRFDAEGISIPFPHRTLVWEGKGRGAETGVDSGTEEVTGDS